VTRVLADDLDNNQFSSLVEFMELAPIGKLARRGKRIAINGLTNKKIKFLLRKFLHTNHLSEYNILTRADTFEIIRIRPEADSKEDERRRHPVPFVLIPPPPTAVKPRLVIEWQGQPPTKKTRKK
jgi:hypothetical protein